MAKSAASLPPPPKSLDATLVTWGGGLEFHRVHDIAFGGSAFNTSTKGNARFSPITDDAGVLIPTLYAGTTLDCALMETIFHDVPFKAGFKPFSKLKMDGKVHSVLLPAGDLRLIDLSTVALHKLGVKRTQLIDTTKAHYPATRRWAQALYTQFPDAQGMRWTSRQDDQAHAVMLFGTRVSRSDLTWGGTSGSLLLDGHTHPSVIDLAARIGVTLVDGAEKAQVFATVRPVLKYRTEQASIAKLRDRVYLRTANHSLEIPVGRASISALVCCR